MSAETQAVVIEGLNCSENGDRLCAVQNFSLALNDKKLSQEVRNLLMDSTVNNLSMLLSDDDTLTDTEYVEACEQGIELLEEMGRIEGQTATVFLIRAAIGHHELGNVSQKRAFMAKSRTAMKASLNWDAIDGGVEPAVRRETIKWATTALTALDK